MNSLGSVEFNNDSGESADPCEIFVTQHYFEFFFFFAYTLKVVVFSSHSVKPFTHVPNLQTKSAKLQAHFLLYTVLVKQT